MSRDKLRFVFIKQSGGSAGSPIVSKVRAPRARKTSLKVAPHGVVWFRGFGGVALLATVVLIFMKSYFWWSVAVGYLGFSFAVADLTYEQFPPVIKGLTIALVLSLAGAFTWLVVLHKSPMQYEYRVHDDRLELEIRNDSHDDYNDLDLLIQPAPLRSNKFVGSLQFENADPSCSFTREPGTIRNGHRGLFYSADGKVHMDWPDVFRVRCTTLPRDYSLWMDVGLVAVKDPIVEGPPVPAQPVGVPSVTGQFSGKFRRIAVDTYFTSF